MTARLPLLKEDGEFNENVRPYQDIKPELPYMEFQIADECNLKCRNCFHYSNMVNEPRHMDLASFHRSFEGLQKKFRNIRKVRILGGEPLLNSELSKYIRGVRDHFPNTEIHVVTNGLKLLDASEELIEAMRLYGNQFTISNYPPVRKKLSQIIKLLDERGIRYEITKPIEYFFLRTTRDACDYQTSFRLCVSRHCHFLRNEKLYLCTHVPMLYENRDYFGLDIPSEEFDQYGADLLDPKVSGWDILKMWENPMRFCRFCSIRKDYRPWAMGTVQQEDWLVDNRS